MLNNLLVFGVKYTDIAVIGSLEGSRYSSVTSRSLSFILSGNFCMSKKIIYEIRIIYFTVFTYFCRELSNKPM
jgi:hypothetical protein